MCSKDRTYLETQMFGNCKLMKTGIKISLQALSRAKEGFPIYLTRGMWPEYLGRFNNKLGI